jgi:predicted DNA-binding protein with PD1-like motif
MKVLYRAKGATMLRFDIGDDLIPALSNWCVGNSVHAAAVVAGIGMLKDMTIGRYDGAEYSTRKVGESSEILSLQGDISMKEGEPFVHLHVSLADEEFRAVGGHLFGGTVSMTIEMLLIEMETEFVRIPSGGSFWRLDTGD